MGRIAGVTAEETRQRLLDAAAGVFAAKGYDGAGVAEIATAAGVSPGAIYSHFPSKAELYSATLHAHGAEEIERLLAIGSGQEALATIGQRGIALGHRQPEEGSLLVGAIVAARRHPEVRDVLRREFGEREQRFSRLITAGQLDGTITPDISASAASRFVTMLVLGSLLVAAMDLPTVEEDDWAGLIDDLVGRFLATDRQPRT